MVTRALVGDGDTAERLAASATEWVQQHGDSVEPYAIAWVVSRAVAECLEASEHGLTGTTDLAELLRTQPVAGQVAIALTVACRYDVPTTAQLTRRPVHEIEALLAPLGAPHVSRGTPPGVPPLPPPEPIRPKKQRRFRPRLGAVLILVGLGALVALVTYDGGPRPTLVDAASPADCDPVGNPLQLAVGPTRRPARLSLPDRRPAPLLVDIGETGQTSADRADTSGLETVAGDAGFAVLTLDGSTQPWNVSRSPMGIDDLGYLTAAIAEAGATGCVDAASVALVGFGRGAHLAAVAICAGSVTADWLIMARGQYLPPGCRLDNPPSVLILADANDRTFPPNGGWGIDGPGGTDFTPTGVDAALRGWGDLAGCTAAGPVSVDPDGTQQLARAGCTTGRQVAARVVNGAGHEWPDSLAVEVVEAISSR
jgi:polyhydroxybutyrate depolymerase